MVGNPILNPFTSFLSTGEFLPTGREFMLEEIATVITQPSYDNRDFHGLPGVGKSALLRYVAGPAFIDAYRPKFLGDYRRKPHRLFIVYVSGWIDSIHPWILLYREFYRCYQAYRERMGREDTELALRPMEWVDVGQDAGRALDLLEPYLRALKEVGIRVVALLDEFDSPWAFGRLTVDDAARLNSWRDYFSFICTTEKLLEDVNPQAKEKGSPLFKRLTPRPFANLTPDGAGRFVREVLRRRGAVLPADEIRCLVEMTGGFPYLLLLGGQALWDLRERVNIAADPRRELSPEMRNFLQLRMGQEFSRTFNLFFHWLSEEEQNTLIDLALAGAMSLSNGGERIVHLTGLEHYGLVTFRGDGVELFSPLFRDFLTKRASTAPATETAEPDLTRLQADLYEAFRRHPKEELSYAELGRLVWSWPAGRRVEEIDETEKRKIHLAVHKLRGELERAGRGERIVNLRKRGYRYDPAA